MVLSVRHDRSNVLRFQVVGIVVVADVLAVALVESMPYHYNCFQSQTNDWTSHYSIA